MSRALAHVFFLFVRNVRLLHVLCISDQPMRKSASELCMGVYELWGSHLLLFLYDVRVRQTSLNPGINEGLTFAIGSSNVQVLHD